MTKNNTKDFYVDAYGHLLILTREKIEPYKGAEKTIAYKMEIYQTWDNNRQTYLEYYDSKSEAKKKIKSLSCGTYEKYIG